MGNEQTKGWLLYDASCGFCDRWVQFWRPTLAKRGFLIEPLQSEFARANVQLPENALLGELRLLLAGGTMLEGANAYRSIGRIRCILFRSSPCSRRCLIGDTVASETIDIKSPARVDSNHGACRTNNPPLRLLNDCHASGAHQFALRSNVAARRRRHSRAGGNPGAERSYSTCVPAIVL